jgi:polysaccharide biosynthesis transport protein
MDFVYLYRTILKWKWVIIGATILASLIAFAFMLNEPKLYKSTSQISTGFAIDDAIKVNSENSGSDYNIYETDTKFNNAVVTMESPTVVSLLSYKLILHDLQSPRPYKILSAKQRSSKDYMEADKEEAIRVFSDKLDRMTLLTSFLPNEKKLLQLLAIYGYDYESISKELNVYRLQHTDYIQIEYKSPHPELSAFVVNDVFQEFLRYYTSMRNAKSTQSVDTLKSLMDKKKEILNAKNDTLRSVGQVELGIEATSKLDQISESQNKLDDDKDKSNRNRYQLVEINDRLAILHAEATGAPLPTAGADEMQQVRKQMNDAYADYRASNYTDQSLYSKYIKLRDHLNTLTGSSTDAGTKYASGNTSITSLSQEELMGKNRDLEAEQQGLADDINRRESTISELNKSLTAASSKSAETSSLLKDEELANTEYLEAKRRYNDATDITSSNVSNFRQILEGQPAIQPEPSKKLIIVSASGVAVLVTCILILAFQTYMDTSIKTPLIFQRVVNLKLISMINLMNFRNKNLSDVVAKGGAPGVDDPLEKKRDNLFRESLRKLRYEIENSGKKVFLFTSTKKGEGKTTIIQALAYSMSLSKKRILVIDTNFCNNDLTVQMGAKAGLEKIDMQGQNVDQLVTEIKDHATEVVKDSVYIIGCEGGDYTPSEILPREHLLRYLKSLTNSFDYIFLEGPPLNDFSDSKELMEYVDGVIAIFSAKHIIKQIDNESIAFLKNMNGKFCGSVLNMVDLENVKYSV